MSQSEREKAIEKLRREHQDALRLAAQAAQRGDRRRYQEYGARAHSAATQLTNGYGVPIYL